MDLSESKVNEGSASNSGPNKEGSSGSRSHTDDQDEKYHKVGDGSSSGSNSNDCNIDLTSMKHRILGLEKWTSKIHEAFARLGTPIPLLSDKILPSSKLCCLGGAIDSPNNFFVNPLQTWNELEAFMKTIQFTYRTMVQGLQPVTADLSRPDRNALLPGLYVVVWYKEEWHRARILKRLDDETFSVRLIDFGDTRDMDLIDIRYMMKSLTEFPAQAVHCRLLVETGRDVDGLKKAWLPTQSKLFLELLYNRGLAIAFKESTMEWGERTWLVNMQILKNKFTASGGKLFMSQQDIEDALLSGRMK